MRPELPESSPLPATPKRSAMPMRRLGMALSPAGFGLSYVVLTFRELPTPVSDVIRPAVIVLAASVALVLLIALLARRLEIGSIMASLIVLAVNAPLLFASAIGAAIAVAAIQVVCGRWSLGAWRELSLRGTAHATSVFAGAYLLVSVLVSAPAMFGSVIVRGDSATAGTADLPNVYLLLLDGYPRSDTLDEVFGYDNRPFTDALAGLGFEVAENSRSNYTHSWLTKASLLNGAYLNEVPGVLPAPGAPADQYRILMRAISDGRMLDVMRHAGYEIVDIAPPFESLAISSADRTVGGGQLTDFEYSLLTNSELGRPLIALFPSFLVDQQRERFDTALGAVESLAVGASAPPQFVFAHVFSPPHAPLVYGADGERLPLADCVPSSCSLWEFPDDEAWAALPGQIEYLNKRIIDTVNALIDFDPDAVVVLMSDHGSRRSKENVDEFFRTLFAARTPGHDVFPDDVSPVNVLRGLVDAYTPVKMDQLEYRSWYSPIENRPLNVEAYGS